MTLAHLLSKTFRVESGCMIFKLDRTHRYPNVKHEGRQLGAHCLAWMLANNSEIPEGKIIRHTCDMSRCINPEHLIPGTHQDNVRDCCERGRAGKKLSAKTVASIRSKLMTVRVVALAAEYGVSRRTIEKIRRGDTWKYVAPK